MRRYCFPFLLPLLLAACSESDPANDPDIPDAGKTAIAFATDVEQSSSTRAGTTGALNLDGLQKTGFGVFAFNTGSANYSTGSFSPDFMYNQNVGYSNSSWTYNPVKYWPADGGKVSFFAYAPYVSSYSSDDNGIYGMSSNTSTAAPTLSYRLAENCNSVDLLWGVDADGNPLTDQTVSSSAVKFYFRHALTRIGGATEDASAGMTVVLNASSGYDSKNTRVTISKIRLEQIGLEATSDASHTSSVYTSGTFNLYSGAWSNCSATAVSSEGTSPYQQLISIADSVTISGAQASLNSNLAELVGTTNSDGSKTVGWSLLPKGVTTTATNVYGVESLPFLMIPVSGYKPVMRLTITYVTRVKDDDATASYRQKWTTTTTTFTLAQEPKPSYRYNIAITLGLDDIVKVYSTIILDKVTGETYKGPDIREEDPRTDDKPWMSKRHKL